MDAIASTERNESPSTAAADKLNAEPDRPALSGYQRPTERNQNLAARVLQSLAPRQGRALRGGGRGLWTDYVALAERNIKGGL